MRIDFGMRTLLAILHLLVGLLAIACVGGFVAWVWPATGQPVWIVAYALMAMLVVTSIVRMIRKPGSA